MPCGVRADQTCLALFFFLRLGGQIRLRESTRIFGMRPARVSGRAVLPCGRTPRTTFLDCLARYRHLTKNWTLSIPEKCL
jgi:hypothetical protein